MRLIVCALLFFLPIEWAFSQDAKEIAALIKPERLKLVACLSDLTDRSKAQGMSDVEFKSLLPQACPHEFEELRKAMLEHMPTPGIDGNKREELVTSAARLLFVRIYNEFSGQRPYRYRLRDEESQIGPTREDIAFRSARERYSECLSKGALDAKTTGMTADNFKNSLGAACVEEADAVRQTELSLWDTYARPPSNRDTAGKLAITSLRARAVRQYNGLK